MYESYNIHFCTWVLYVRLCPFHFRVLTHFHYHQSHCRRSLFDSGCFLQCQIYYFRPSQSRQSISRKNQENSLRHFAISISGYIDQYETRIFFFLLYFLPNMEHQDPVNLVDISHIKRITPTADWNTAPFKGNNGKVREYPDGLQRHYVTS